MQLTTDFDVAQARTDGTPAASIGVALNTHKDLIVDDREALQTVVDRILYGSHPAP